MSRDHQYIPLGKMIFLEWGLLMFGLGLYYLFPFFSFYFENFSSFGIGEEHKLIQYGLYFFGAGYLLISPLILSNKAKKGIKSRMLKLMELSRNKSYGRDFQQIILTFLLKFFFIPLMFLGSLKYGLYVFEGLKEADKTEISNLGGVQMINTVVFPLFVNLAMLSVLVIYTIGYCYESERFKTKISSVDDSWFSWLVTVICYAPFFYIAFYFIPLGAENYAFYKNHEITAVVRVFLILVISFKVWSIFTLGMRSSNLTNRGIETRGPYKFVRHPHYLAKIIVWWIGVLPAGWHYPWLFGGMIFWTTIYVLRAMTEELHLKRDVNYRAYMAQVKWRFIPGVF